MSQRAKRILVTGANGFVGRHVCTEIIKRGWQVRVACRTTTLCTTEFESVVVGEIDSQTDWAVALHNIDAVIHLAARVHVMRDDSSNPLSEFRRINTLGTERLARCAVASGVKRIVYVSSIKVNGELTEYGQQFTEQDIPRPLDPYGVSKWEAEKALHKVAKESGLEVVIVRPPLVYGVGVKGNFVHMLNALGNGVPLPLASVHNQRSLIYVDNLADVLVTCAAHPHAIGQTFLVSDGEDVSTPDLLRYLADAMGLKARVFPFPQVLLRLLGHLTGKSKQLDRLLDSLRVDSGKIRYELDWTPPYSLQQGLRATAIWYNSIKL